MLPSNFPFSSPAAVEFASLDKVHDLLQSHRDQCQSYIGGYLALYQPIYPIVNDLQLSDMVAKFWNDPKSIDVSCLSCFLMVLALGCFAVTRDQDSTTKLCMAAEACLNKTPFMVQPSISVVQTLCLMVIAKQTANASCRTFDSCWTFLGVVTRVAIGMNLNKQRAPQTQSAEAIGEWKSGKLLWSFIVYSCIHMATITGKPSLISVDELAAEPVTFSSTTETIDPWITLVDAYPTICHIISRVNNDVDTLSYDEVLEYNHQVRQLMSMLGSIKGRPLLYITFDIFFRRILLILHRLHALHPCAPFDYPISYWSSLECSLAVLVHYRDLCEQKEKDLNNKDLLGRLFKIDFLSSMLTIGLHLLRYEAPLATGFSIPPRRIILDTLQACTNIWERETHHSMCFRIGHRLLTSVLEVLLEESFAHYISSDA